MMGANPAYPGQSVMENKWDIKEVEQEFRAQIEMALKNIPQLSHMTGHMLSTGFTKEVNELVLRLAKEYNLPSIDRMDSPEDYRFTYIGIWMVRAGHRLKKKRASSVPSINWKPVNDICSSTIRHWITKK